MNWDPVGFRESEDAVRAFAGRHTRVEYRMLARYSCRNRLLADLSYFDSHTIHS